jgi:hypothetical protein
MRKVRASRSSLYLLSIFAFLVNPAIVAWWAFNIRLAQSAIAAGALQGNAQTMYPKLGFL